MHQITSIFLLAQRDLSAHKSRRLQILEIDYKIPPADFLMIRLNISSDLGTEKILILHVSGNKYTYREKIKLSKKFGLEF